MSKCLPEWENTLILKLQMINIHILEEFCFKSIKYIISYLFGSIVVNLSCKNSYYYTVQEIKF